MTGPRIGVVGAGGIGKTHLKAWAANGISPAAIAEPNSPARDAAVAEYGGVGFDNGVALIASGTVDAVSVCTPPAFHADLVVTALESGVAVLCEKPLAHTLTDAERIAKAAAESGTLLAVGFCHRFQPHIVRLKELIDGGELGSILTFRNRFAGHNSTVDQTWFSDPAISGGGALADTSIHSIDLFRYLVGEPIAAQALISATSNELGSALRVEDTAILTVQTGAGALGSIETSWRTPAGEWTVTVHGSRGAAVVDYTSMTLRTSRNGAEWIDVDVADGNRFALQAADFLECLANGSAPRAGVADGLAANRILDAAYRSAKKPTPVIT